MKQFLLVFSLVFIPLFSFSQQIEGKVLDESGIPLAGVNLVCSVSKNYAITDFDGNFTLITTKDDMVTVSYVGFKTQTLKPTPLMNIVLVEEITALNDVVLVGYGTKKAGAITGAVVQLKSDEILKNPAQSAIQAIQGKVAGVNIVSNDEPGASPTITIRGLGTVLGGRDPLYVVNGIEMTNLNGISSNDIETIDILKDASSLAIYGQKGSNGVVLITTKKGKIGTMSVNIESYYGQKSIQRTVDMADSSLFAYYNNVARGSSSFYNLTQPVNTNWLKEITQKGHVTNNSISISGANENANYYLGISNYKEDGILIGSEFERTNVNTRNEFKINDKLKITQNLNLSNVNSVSKPLSAFTSAYKQSPIMPVYNSNGRFAVPIINSDGFNDMSGIERYNNVSNPVADLYYANNKSKNFTLFGAVGAEYQILKEFKFNSNFGGTFNWNKGYSYTANRDIWLYQNPTKEISDYPTPDITNTLNVGSGNSYNWNWDNYATYSKKFNNHNVTLVAGISRTTINNSEYINGTRYNVPEQSNYWSLNLATNNVLISPNTVVSNQTNTPIVTMAYFGRAEYTFKDTYLFSASVRREGISNFQQNKRWENFPAASAGWIISNESFLEKSKAISFLKIRGGYGITANGRGTPSLNNILFSAGNNYSLGTNSTIVPGSYVPYQIDPNLTWEKLKEVNIGLDFRLFNDAISGSVDVYNRKTDNIILPVNYPAVLSPGAVYVNAGQLTNKGVEIALNYKKEINKNLNFSIGGNYTQNTNIMSKVYNPFFQNLVGGSLNNGYSTKQVIEGQPLGSFYVYEFKGINPVDGTFILSDNKVNAGSYIPKYTYGINLNVSYKRFDLSTYLYGVGGNKIYNGKKAQRFGGENIEASLLQNFWSLSTPNASNPKPFNDVPLPSTYYLEDGSYLRVNNITLGYTLPEFLKIEKVRLYVTATNPFLFTKYSGFSPEITGDPLGGAGIELDAYPTNKTFLLGANLTF